MYLPIDLALTGFPDGRQVASHMAKSMSSCSASSLASSGDAAVKRVRGLVLRPKMQNLSHHRTPVDLAPPARSLTAELRYRVRRDPRSFSVCAASIASANASVPGQGRRKLVSACRVGLSFRTSPQLALASDCRRRRRFRQQPPPLRRLIHTPRRQTELSGLLQHLRDSGS